MPIFYQQSINAHTKLGIWKIEEEEAFFRQQVSVQRTITHAHKRLQHLAGRYLLRHLFPSFPLHLIEIADTRKPFLKDESYHFSISHCGAFAAVIASTKERVGIDIEIKTDKVVSIAHKFLHPEEQKRFEKGVAAYGADFVADVTLLWCAKEALFKWWGWGGVDFSEMLRVSGSLQETSGNLNAQIIHQAGSIPLLVHYKKFSEVNLAWVHTQQ